MAFCDMTTSGGGWELVLRASSSDSVFTWESDYWTSDNLLDSNVDDDFRIGNDQCDRHSAFTLQHDHWLTADSLVELALLKP